MSLSDTLNCDSCGREIPVEAEVCPCGTEFDAIRRVSEAALERLGHREETELPKCLTGDPTEAGYRTSRLGKRKGQSRDYRMKASSLGRDEDGRELHIREYEDSYTLHWDAYPARNPMHAVKDAPDYGAVCVAAAGLVAAAVGSGIARRRGSQKDNGSGPGLGENVTVAVGGETENPGDEKKEEDEKVEGETKSSIRDGLPSVGIGRRVVGSLSGLLGRDSRDE